MLVQQMRTESRVTGPTRIATSNQCGSAAETLVTNEKEKKQGQSQRTGSVQAHAYGHIGA